MRNHALDLLRGLAAFGIVGCHLALSPLTSTAWALRSFCDMNVCLFAAISGYFMVGREGAGVNGNVRDCRDYILRRAWRLLPLYAFWTVAYLALGTVFDLALQHNLDPRRLRPSFYIGALFWGDSSTHLWFLFYAQVLLKILTSLTGRLSGWVWFFLGLALILVSVFWSSWVARYPIRLLAALVAGYGIRLLRLSCPKGIGGECRWYCVALLVLCLICHFLLRRAIPVFILDWLLALSILACLSEINFPAQLGSIARFASQTSLGVFCFHPIFAAFFGIFIRRVFCPPYGWGALCLDWVLVWGVSLAATILMLRWPLSSRFAK